MRTTSAKVSRAAFLLVIILSLAAIAMAGPKKKDASHSKGPVFELVGQVERVNKGRTFELTTEGGQRYLVHVPKNMPIRLTPTSSYSQQFTSFESLRKWQRVSLKVAHLSEPLAATGKPIPVQSR
jgi:hypothetical protein